MRWYRILGYHGISLAGPEKERFLKLCQYHEITLYQLNVKDDIYTFDIGLGNLQKLKELGAKTDVALHIEKAKGLGVYAGKLRKRYILGVFIIFILGIILTMNQFIWHITLSGNRELTKEMLIDFLKLQDCSIGMDKHSIDCDRLENRLRDTYPYLTWVCIQISGTNLIVSVKENELDLNAYETASNENDADKTESYDSQSGENNTSKEEIFVNEPNTNRLSNHLSETVLEPGSNLIAENDGVITKLLLKNGCTKLHVGDEITKGEIIVEGQIPIYNITGDTVISYEYVVPEADIRVQMAEKYSNNVDKWVSHKVRTGRCVKFPYLIFGNRIFETDKEPCFEQEECVRTFRQLHLFGDFYLPVYYGAIEVYETSEYISLKSYQQLLNELELEYMAYRRSLVNEGNQLLFEEHCIIDTLDGLILEADMTVERKAELAVTKPVTMPTQVPNE